MDEAGQEWMSRHPDGRRWIGYEAETCLVDRARATSGASWSELAGMSTDEVLRLALGDSPGQGT